MNGKRIFVVQSKATGERAIGKILSFDQSDLESFDADKLARILAAFGS